MSPVRMSAPAPLPGEVNARKKKHLLNVILAGVLSAALVVLVVCRALCPVLVLPGFGVPNLVLICLIALVLEHYLVPGAKRCYICIPVFSALTFGLLPFAAAFAGGMEALKLAVVGGVVFTVTTWLFTTIQERLSTGPAAKASAFFSAVSLYMAAQCFVGIIL